MKDMLTAFETHDAEAIAQQLRAGFDPNTVVDGKLATQVLVEMYYRSDKFTSCLRLMVDAGGRIDDMLLLPVLLDDRALLETSYAEVPSFLEHRANMACAFTSLEDVALLHVAVEYGSSNAVEWLLAKGADVNARAGIRADGANGHTPIFHAVNSNANRTAPILRRLLGAGADAKIALSSLWWGQGFEWETVFFDVTPISYAQMGLLPQVHRREQDVYANIQTMLSAAGRPIPRLTNIPNRYLAS